MNIAHPRSISFDWTWLAVVPAGLLLGGFLILPAGLGLAGSFTSYSTPGLPWQFVGLVNYQAVLADPDLQAALGNVVALTLLTVPAATGAGLGLALLLRRPFRGRSALRALLLAPWLVSPVAAGVLWHFLYNSQVGLTGWLAAWAGQGDGFNPLGATRWALPALALVETWRVTPLATFLLLPGVQAVPQDDLDQATLAGSPPWTILTVAVLPRIRALLLTVLLLLIGESLTVFDSVLILTGGGPGHQTLTPALYSYTQVVAAHAWPRAAASAWLLAAVIVLVGLVYMCLLRRTVAR